MTDPDSYPEKNQGSNRGAAWAEAIARGLEAETAERFPGKGTFSRQPGREVDLAAALQELEGEVNAVEIRFLEGAEGNVLVLVPRREFIRLGRALLDRPVDGDDVLSPEIMSASLGFFGKAMERAALELGRTAGRAVRCGAPELLDPEGNRAAVLPLAPSYESALGLRGALSLDPSAVFAFDLLVQRQLLDSWGRTAAARTAPQPGTRPPSPADHPPSHWNMDLILDVELGVVVSFGQTRMPLRDVLKLGVGSVIELDKGVNDPVAVIVNDKRVATGEVVMVDGNYGVKILEVESTADRIRSLA